MKRQSVGSGVSWETDFGYSRATRIGDRILVSGTTATGPDGPVAIGDPGEQTRYAIEKIRAAIESLGGRLEDVVRTRVHVKPGNLLGGRGPGPRRVLLRGPPRLHADLRGSHRRGVPRRNRGRGGRGIGVQDADSGSDVVARRRLTPK